MALVYDSRFRVLDSNANPVNGGTLTIYTAGTTTPAAIFRDAALVTPMSNPTTGADKADAAGRFPQIYSAEGSIFDILLKDAGGSVLATYLSVISLGSDTGTIKRDFTTSRFQVRGAGGVTFVEAGDPTGDDVGGQLTLGGWNGTQADAVIINAAAASTTGNLTVGGALTVGATQLDNIIATGTAAGVSTLDIPLSQGLFRYRLELLDTVLSATGGLVARFAFDGVPTFKVGSTDYGYVVVQSQTGAVTPSGNASTTGIQLNGGLNITSAEVNVFMIDIMTTANVTAQAHTLIEATSLLPDTGNMVFNKISGRCGPSYGRATFIRLFPASGTFSAKWRLLSGHGF